MRSSFLALAALALGLCGLAADISPAHAGPDAERGRYLARIMDCGGCHTPGALAGQPNEAAFLGGSDIGFEIPAVGIFYPPNLTSDPQTGLGAWTKEEIVAAVTKGIRPDGRELAPIMPWRAYAALSDEDAMALAAYIHSLPPVDFSAPGPFGPGERTTHPYLTVKLPE